MKVALDTSDLMVVLPVYNNISVLVCNKRFSLSCVLPIYSIVNNALDSLLVTYSGSPCVEMEHTLATVMEKNAADMYKISGVYDVQIESINSYMSLCTAIIDFCIHLRDIYPTHISHVALSNKVLILEYLS